MGLPGKQRSRTTKRKRASHFALDAKSAIACSACGAKVMPHRACSACGSYKGKKIIDVAKRAARKAKKTIAQS